MADARRSICDLVLEGGGVKGIGLVGAITELEKTGHVICRVGGTSAGAVVGALVAAGMNSKQLAATMQRLDYTKFRDEGLLDKAGWLGQGISLLFEKGIYEGKYVRTWLSEQLAQLGVETFADLRLEEPWAKRLPPSRRYKLVVIAADVSSGRMVRLPWDYHRYGLDPDKQLVADAVRASMSIPFFYEPARLRGSYLVDGGILSNFPIDIFDDTSQWPTFGIKLSAKEEANTKINPVGNPVAYLEAVASTAMNAHDQMHLDDPCTVRRTMFVDTFDIKSTDFDISKAAQRTLFESGQRAARKFLAHWDYQAYQRVCGLPRKQ